MLGTETVKGSKTHKLVTLGLLSAAATVIMFLEFMVPMMPTFLKIDLSEIPVLLGTFALGPVAGVAIELVKNLIHLTSTQTAGIGEMANFIVGVAFVIPAGLIYKVRKDRTGAITALLAGTISMVVFSAFFNYFVLIPLYQKVLSFPAAAIVGMGTKANASIVDLKTFIAYAIVPFNLLKGIVISVVTLLIYKKLSPILHK